MQLFSKQIKLKKSLTWLAHAFVFRDALLGDQRNGASSTFGTDLNSARIDATTALAILRIHILLLAVRTTDDATFLLSLRATIFRIPRVHNFIGRCNIMLHVSGEIVKFCSERRE